MKKTFTRLVCLCLTAAVFAMLSGCEKTVKSKFYEPPSYTSFRDIPGLTADEISDAEKLLAEVDYFVYGTVPSTETFFDGNNEVTGFTAMFCEWMSGLFDKPFVPEFYEWGELVGLLESGEVDFTGELTATDERRQTYLMTDAIAERSVKYIRIADSVPLAAIAEAHMPRYAFLSDAITVNEVGLALEYNFEPFFVDSYEEAYKMLKSNMVDAFIDESTAEAAFDVYGDVVTEDLFPLIHSTVSLTTQNPRNEPVIKIMQKALQSGGLRYLTEMYNRGMYDYEKYKLFINLTEEEKTYIKGHPVIEYAADHDNYPISFYNTYDDEFQGICQDILKEVGALTGLNFDIKNNKTDDWADILKMLEEGEVSMVSELIKTPEKTGRFLWAKIPVITDDYALLSKSEMQNIKINEIIYMKIGLVADSAQAEIFMRWFPSHANTVFYDNFDQAFEALQHDDIDMVMSGHNQLLSLTNFRELPGYKANIIFNAPYNSTFGFNKNETVLCSIVDKALRMVEVESLAGQWTGKTYDYRNKVTQARLPWLIGAVILLVLMMVLVSVMLYRSHQSGKRLIALQNVVMETMAELVEYRDDMTGGHIGRTSKYLKMFLDEIITRGLYKEQTSAWDIDQMVVSAQLHDVGKIAIHDSILNKPGKLTFEEFNDMKRHTLFGGEIIEKIQTKTSEKEFLEYAKIFTLYHHERWDGTGYPYGMKGESIPLPARLMSIIDVYDALVSKRPYKEPYTHKQAIEIISEGRGTQFDPILTDLFLALAEQWPFDPGPKDIPD